MDEVQVLADKIASYMASGAVRRYHTITMIGEQTDAEHSARALTLLLLLYPHPGPSLALVKAMLWHDNAERVVGDVPAPVLRANTDYRELYVRLENVFFASEQSEVYDALKFLDVSDVSWLRAMDRLELFIHCLEQQWLGNRHAKIIGDRAAAYMRADPATPPIVDQLIGHMMEHGIRSFA